MDRLPTPAFPRKSPRPLPILGFQRARLQVHAHLLGGSRAAILAVPLQPRSGRTRTLFSPEQLFGEFGTSADVLVHAPFLERARREREHGREPSARLALGAYVAWYARRYDANTTAT